jgi:DNA-binding YbaB/EbfC family protein
MKMKQLQKMMKQAQQMQQKMEEEMSQLAIEGQSGGGMVTVTLDGKKNLTAISIKPEVIDPDDTEMLEDLILAAFNDASRKVDEKLNAQIGNMGGDLLGGLGGL